MRAPQRHRAPAADGADRDVPSAPRLRSPSALPPTPLGVLRAWRTSTGRSRWSWLAQAAARWAAQIRLESSWRRGRGEGGARWRGTGSGTMRSARDVSTWSWGVSHRHSARARVPHGSARAGHEVERPRACSAPGRARGSRPERSACADWMVRLKGVEKHVICASSAGRPAASSSAARSCPTRWRRWGGVLKPCA